MELKQSNVEVTDTVLRLPTEFPPLPDEVRERFPSTKTYEQSVDRWWRATQNVLNDFSAAVTNITEVGGVLTVDGDNGAMYIRKIRGVGGYADPDTAFFVNDRGYLSLKNSLTWNPDTNTLTIEGTIIATAGTIGGFDIGTDYIRDAANSFGLSSVVTGGDDVRFWAGDTFANRATAPFRVYESGAVVATNATITGTITATSGTIGGFSIGADYIRDAANSMGLASTVTGGDDVRFWAGDTFANRATAPFRVTEAGVLTATNAVISGTITSSTIVVGHTAQISGFASNLQIVNASGSTNEVQNFAFGAGTPNFTGLVADGTVGTPTGASSGRLMKLKLVTFGSGGGGWITGGNASIWLRTTEAHTNTARGTEIEFRTTPNGSISEQVCFLIGQDNRLYIGASTDTNLYRSAANTLKTDDAFQSNSLATVNFEASVTTRVDVKDVNFAVYNGATQNARIDYTTGFYYVQGNNVVGARGTKGAGTIAEVVTLLDAWGAWV